MLGDCRFRSRVCVAVVALLGIGAAAAPSAVSAAGRVALVVGNSDYAAIGALPNPGNDAADVAAALGRLGFDVTPVLDADRVAMNEALRTFTRESVGADVALVFYAGHGLEMDGVNYLVPVDARLERDTDVRFEAVELDDVLAATAGAELRVVILDACRNNPLARSMQRTSTTRNVSRGSFGELDENLLGDETLVAYAAAAGTTAADGTGRNSPYTTALLEYLEQPLEIGILFREVRGRVLAATGGEQRPHEYASLLEEHYLRGASGQPGTVADTASADVRGQQETVFWQSISGSANLADYQAYLQQFPNGVFARLARNRIRDLGRVSADRPVANRPLAGADPERDPPLASAEPDELTASPVNESANQLVPNRSANGFLDDRSRRAGRWTLEGAARQRITVEVSSDDFDTTVRLLSPSGDQIGYDDDGGDGRNSRLVALLPVAGRYEAIVEPYGGNGDGTYEVKLSTLQLIPARTAEGILNRNDSRTATWPLEVVDAGQRVAVEVSSDDFDTTVRLLSPSGDQIGYDDDGGAGVDSRLVAMLPISGRYEVVVAPYASGSGRYQIRMYPLTMAALFLEDLDSGGVQEFGRKCSRVIVVSNRDMADHVVRFHNNGSDGASVVDSGGGILYRFSDTFLRRSLFDDVCEYF